MSNTGHRQPDETNRTMAEQKQKTESAPEGATPFVSRLSAVSGELAHMEHDARLDVRSLVLVNDVRLSELVEHLLHFGKKFYSSSLVSRGAELTHCVTHRLGIVAIVQATSGGLTNSFHRGFVICHFE